jgi:hypothetical protein
MQRKLLILSGIVFSGTIALNGNLVWSQAALRVDQVGLLLDQVAVLVGQPAVLLLGQAGRVARAAAARAANRAPAE